MPKKTASLIMILLAAGLFILLNGCTKTSFTYGIIGTPAISNNGEYVTILVAESKGITRQINGGYRATEYNSSYWLKHYETSSGKLLRKKKIIAATEKMNMLPLCYGGYADKIWLHTSGLVAYDINTLQEVVNEEMLVKQNGFDTNNFPIDQRFIDDNVADGYICFTTMNREKYRIDLNTLKINSENGITRNAAKPQHELLHKIMYATRSDTLNGKIFTLAKDNATAMNSYPGNNDNEAIYKPLYLFTSSYSTSKVGNRILYHQNNMKKFAGTSYINGTFLKDFKTNKIVHLQKPGAFIILHNDSLKNEAKSILTAIDESNHPIWQINTGLSTKLANCIVKNNYCIITGNKNYLLAPHIGSDMLCLVNIQLGKMVSPTITE